MRSSLIAFCLVLAAHSMSAAQTPSGTGTTLPSTCTTGGVYFLAGSSSGIYGCSATNTWSLVLGASTFRGPNGDCSAVTYGYNGDVQSGFALSSVGALLGCAGGGPLFAMKNDGSLNFVKDGRPCWQATNNPGPNAGDIGLWRESPNVLSLGPCAPNVRTGRLELGTVALGTNAVLFTTPVTISGFSGTNAAPISGSVPHAWRVNVGTGSVGSSGSLTLPRVGGGWNCWVKDQNHPNDVQQTSSTLTSVTVSTTGSFTAGDVLVGGCWPFLEWSVATWGDSLTQGVGGTPYPSQLSTSMSANVWNGGILGETSQQIRTRMLNEPTLYPSVAVIWSGRNNFTQTTQIKTDIAAMVAALPATTKYVILSVLNGSTPSEYSGGSDYAFIVTALNGDLAYIYGSHYLDVRAALVAAYDPMNSQDVIDHGRDVPPSSLRSDFIHLNTAGYAVIASQVNTWISTH